MSYIQEKIKIYLKRNKIIREINITSNKENFFPAASTVPSGTTPVPSGTKVIFRVSTLWRVVPSGTMTVPSGPKTVPSGTKSCRPALVDSFDNFTKSSFLTPFECEFELGFNWKVIDLRILFLKYIFNVQSEHRGLRYDFSKKISSYFLFSNPHFNPLSCSFSKAHSNTINTPNHHQSTYNHPNMQ